jgi:hypothetical protein
MSKGDLVKHRPTGIRGLIISISEANQTALLFYHHGKMITVNTNDLIKIK